MSKRIENKRILSKEQETNPEIVLQVGASRREAAGRGGARSGVAWNGSGVEVVGYGGEERELVSERGKRR